MPRNTFFNPPSVAYARVGFQLVPGNKVKMDYRYVYSDNSVSALMDQLDSNTQPTIVVGTRTQYIDYKRAMKKFGLAQNIFVSINPAH